MRVMQTPRLRLSVFGLTVRLCSAYRGGGGNRLEFLQFRFCTKGLYAVCSVFLRICAGVRQALQAPTVSHERLLGTPLNLFAHF